MILHGLPTDHSSSGTLPIQIHNMGSILQNGLFQYGSPQVAAPARPSVPVCVPFNGLQFSTGACCYRGSPRAAASLRLDPPAPTWSPPQAAMLIAAPIWSAPQRNLCCSIQSTSFRSFFTEFGVCRVVSQHFLIPLSQLLLQNSSHTSHPPPPFLNMLSQRSNQHHSFAQLWPVAGPIK